jgi:hypothetical protein
MHREHAQDQRAQRRRHASRVQRRGEHQRLHAPGAVFILSCLAHRRVGARHELAGGDAQGEEIIGGPGGVGRGEGPAVLDGEQPCLWRAVGWSPGRYGRRREGVRAWVDARAEVGEEEAAVGAAHQRVIAFHVPVNRSLGVKVLERQCHLSQQPQHLRSGGVIQPGPFVQGHAVHEQPALMQQE